MKKVDAAIRGAVIAALAASGALACSSGSGACKVTRPDPLPAPPTMVCHQASYTVTVSDVDACGFTEAPTNCDDVCGQSVRSCSFAGNLTYDCTQATFCGKARTSLRRRPGPREAPLTEHLRSSVWLEAASVHAFERLALELASHGAPRRLLRAAQRAAADEARHTRAMARLAKRHGVSYDLPRAARRRVRSLVNIAIENAVEGCVHETYGVAMARFQSSQAGDAFTRDAMRRIARDETRHADLAANIDRWASTRLDIRERARVERAKAAAAARLATTVRAEPNAELVEILGPPTAAQASAMAAILRRHLWC